MYSKKLAQVRDQNLFEKFLHTVFWSNTGQMVTEEEALLLEKSWFALSFDDHSFSRNNSGELENPLLLFRVFPTAPQTRNEITITSLCLASSLRILFCFRTRLTRRVCSIIWRTVRTSESVSLTITFPNMDICVSFKKLKASRSNDLVVVESEKVGNECSDVLPRNMHSADFLTDCFIPPQLYEYRPTSILKVKRESTDELGGFIEGSSETSDVVSFGC